jgi:hypothetical protein
MLYDFYNVSTDDGLIIASENDWRFCIPTDISENGFVPRTPLVLLANDANWWPLAQVEAKLIEVVTAKRAARKPTRRK